MADKSPYRTGKNHWGVIITEGVIVNRGKKLETLSMDDFLKYAKTITTRVLYGTEYQQHYHFSPYQEKNKAGKATTHYKQALKNEIPIALTDEKQMLMPEGLRK